MAKRNALHYFKRARGTQVLYKTGPQQERVDTKRDYFKKKLKKKISL